MVKDPDLCCAICINKSKIYNDISHDVGMSEFLSILIYSAKAKYNLTCVLIWFAIKTLEARTQTESSSSIEEREIIIHQADELM